MQDLEIKSALQILKPIEEVYEAIIDPEKMKNYFIAESNGELQEGNTVIWKFPEFDKSFPVQVITTQEPEVIVFNWEGATGKTLQVKIELEAKGQEKTLVKITEGKMKNSEEGIEWLNRNSGGWANFLACLKAYLEYDINLRKGSFDFMKS